MATYIKLKTARVKGYIKWFVFNGFQVSMVTLWLLRDVSGAGNVTKFAVWIGLIITIGACNSESKKRMRKKGRAVPLWLDAPADLYTTVLLLWYGHWVLALATVVAALLQMEIYGECRDEKEANA